MADIQLTNLAGSRGASIRLAPDLNYLSRVPAGGVEIVSLNAGPSPVIALNLSGRYIIEYIELRHSEFEERDYTVQLNIDGETIINDTVTGPNTGPFPFYIVGSEVDFGSNGNVLSRIYTCETSLTLTVTKTIGSAYTVRFAIRPIL